MDVIKSYCNETLVHVKIEVGELLVLKLENEIRISEFVSTMFFKLTDLWY